jgi:hypothetical protein
VTRLTTSGLALPDGLFSELSQPLAPGEYVLWDRGGELWLDQPSPPELRVSAWMQSPLEEGDANTPYRYLDFVIQNMSLYDVSVSQMVIRDATDNLQANLLVHPAIIPAQGDQTFRWSWHPTSPGGHIVEVSVQYTDPLSGEPAVVQQTFEVEAEHHSAVLAPLYFSETHAVFLFFVAGLLAGLIAVAVITLTRTPEVTDVSSD